MVTEGIKLEVSCIVKEFRLERVDALRRSSTVAPIRSMQPWSSTGAEGLLPNFLTLWQWSWMCPGWRRLREPLRQLLYCSPWPCVWVCHRIDRGFDPCDIVFLAVSLPLAPNLEARSEGGFRALDVLVLLVLEPEETGLSPLFPFLFAAVWAGGLGDVLPLSFDLSWLVGPLFTGASLAASDQHSQ